MKKLYYALLVFTSNITCSFAQNIDIPDPIFKNYLLDISELNTNKDQEISNNEAYLWSSSTREINVSNMGITSLKGLEAFEQLRKLDCSHNQIHQLNLSNLKYSIDTINVSYNSIDSISFPTSNFYVKYLDWSYNQLKKSPKTSSFYSYIYEFNLSHNNIKSFEGKTNNVSNLDLSHNLLSSLDVFKMSYLHNLNVSHNLLQTLKVPYLLSNVKCDSNNLMSVCVEDIEEAQKNGKKDDNTYWEDCYKITQENCIGPNLSITGACDDFKLAPNSGTDEYLLETNKPRWSGVPEPNEKAYMGLFWSETINKNGFTAKKTRNGDGVLRYAITQPDHTFEPITVSFGSYADGNLEKKFALDLSQNSTLEFIVKNKGKSTINILVSLQDIYGNDLVFKNDYYIDSLNPDYRLQIGNNFNGWVNTDFWSNYADSYYSYDYHNVSKGVSKFRFDFSDAVCGKMINDPYYDQMIMTPCPNIKFDYSNVSMVKIIVTGVNDEQGNNKLSDNTIEIYNFRIGNTVPLAIDDNDKLKDLETIYTAYDLLGNKVAEGKESELHLRHGQIYILKSEHEAFKKVIFE